MAAVSCTPTNGGFEPVVMIARYGETPDDWSGNTLSARVTARSGKRAYVEIIRHAYLSSALNLCILTLSRHINVHRVGKSG